MENYVSNVIPLGETQDRNIKSVFVSTAKECWLKLNNKNVRKVSGGFCKGDMKALRKKNSNYIQIAAPEGFNFGKPNERPIWFKRFQRYRIASGLSEKSENEQVNALVYFMGEKAEENLILLNLNEAQNEDYQLVVSKFQNYFIGKSNIMRKLSLTE
ncbi:hypothetical protein LAZ67_4001927 [Cordylochernes scorpioides]|uniref:Uncharacterized protein n=1 Tax=Cordylochernes scorpioides TaxID=51811 RepID=A0ABY6KFD8_9ARAC|nr:hypothetical protein LAZ67_4001927 [Cordylochernes scorpioides]